MLELWFRNVFMCSSRSNLIAHKAWFPYDRSLDRWYHFQRSSSCERSYGNQDYMGIGTTVEPLHTATRLTRPPPYIGSTKLTPINFCPFLNVLKYGQPFMGFFDARLVAGTTRLHCFFFLTNDSVRYIVFFFTNDNLGLVLFFDTDNVRCVVVV